MPDRVNPVPAVNPIEVLGKSPPAKWVVDLEKIGRAISNLPPNGRSALLPSVSAHGIVLRLLSAFEQPEVQLVPSRHQKRGVQAKTEIDKYVPVGLLRCIPYCWINALMQFVLFLPDFARGFSFLPRSLEVFREFAEQYTADQKEGRTISLANSADVVRCLMRKLSPQLFRTPHWVDLYAVFMSICELLSCRYLWNVEWDASSSFTLPQVAKAKLDQKPPELLVRVRGMQVGGYQRQFFTNDYQCFDLDAFIEYRPDGHSQAGFITYIKSEGTWYQCDDERVTVLLSSALSIPLRRAVLLHYKRVHL